MSLTAEPSALRHRRHIASNGHTDNHYQAYPERHKQATRAHRQPVRYDRIDASIALFLTLLASLTRLWGLDRSNRVTWDEAHFGRFGAMYLNGTYIHDVHPPLAKLTITLAQYLAGHNGTFAFGGGAEYPEYVNYALMRAQIALFGISLAPLAYLTCRKLGFTRHACTLAGLFVVFDNAICLMSRLILLDGPLLAFTALVLFCLVNFTHESMFGVEFGRAWWSWLAATGLALGLVLSSKWVGAFSVMLVGCAVLEDLYCKLHSHTSWSRYARHWAARALALIVLPIGVYVAVFRVHYSFQTAKGYGEHEMPVPFQATLKGNRYNVQPYDIPFGSIAKIKPASKPLESLENIISPKRYHGDPEPQPVGCNSSDIGFDWWRIQNAYGSGINYDNATLEYVHHLDIVTLKHDHTHKFLYVDSQDSDALEHQYYNVQAVQVGNKTYGYSSDDANWVIELVNQAYKGDGMDMLHPLNTEFRLRHSTSGCILALSHPPQFSTGQGVDNIGHTIVCMLPEAARRYHDSTLWRIEFNVDLRVGFDGDSSAKFRRQFFQDMLRQNGIMARSNNALIPDPDKYNHLESPPWSWPLLVYPMRIGDWQENYTKFYELGNPILWWSVAAICVA
ncbi:Protein O-mannosyltransferase 2, partial [Linderina macrospora]